MSKLKEIQRQATFAWSPLVDRPDLIASGTVAGTIGLDFDTSSKLELYSLDITGQSPQMSLKGSVNAESRFFKLSWLPAHAGQSNGLIVGGMENGSIGIWNPSKILEGEDGHVGTGQKHNGPVQALDYNVVQPNLIASGGSDSELYIWDLSNPGSPSAYSPGNKPQQSEITSISWNKKVQHIIASAYYNGNTYVWDLKSRRSIISFSDKMRRCSTRSVLWNPNEATSIVTASDDDTHPVIQTWDLRFINQPVKTLEGHRRGVYGLSWCPFDSSLLLSCGKDNRTICWNIEKGEILCEIDQASTDPNHWNFDVQWSPRIPAVVATSSFGGNINAYSLQDVNQRAVTPQTNALGVVEPVAAPVFRHTPSWLQRPVGAAFGFGGKIAVFGRRKPAAAPAGAGAASPSSPGAASTSAAQQRVIRIQQVVTEQGLLERADKLETVLKSRNYEEFCEEKIRSSTSAEEKATWGFLKVLFDESSRKKILNYLGHDVESTQNELQNFLKTLPELKLTESSTATTEKSEIEKQIDQQVGENGNEDNGEKKDVFNALFKGSTDELPLEVVKKFNAVPISFPSDGDEQLITKSLLIGDFATAVQCCLRLGRMADALILASCGSTDLWKKTQQAYFEIEQRPFTRVLSCIAREDFATLVETTDLKDWKSTLSILCTYGTEENFKRLAGILGDRLDAADDTEAATLCYICACDIDKTVNIWTRSHQQQLANSADKGEYNNSELLNLIEKVSIFRSATNSTTLSNDTLASKYSKYAEILASQGHLTDSLRYLSALNTTHPSSDPSGLILLDRVYRSCSNVQGIAPPPFPFPIVDVYPTGGAPRVNTNTNFPPATRVGVQPPRVGQPTHSHQPFNQPPQPFNQPPTSQPFNQPPTSQPFNQPPQPFNQPPTSQPFNQPPTSQPFNQPPTSQPFNQPPQSFNQPPSTLSPPTHSHITPPVGQFSHNHPQTVGMPPMTSHNLPPSTTTGHAGHPPPPTNSSVPPTFNTSVPPTFNTQAPPSFNTAAVPPPAFNTSAPPLPTSPTAPPVGSLSPMTPLSPPAPSAPPMGPSIHKASAPGTAAVPSGSDSPATTSFTQPPPKPNVHNTPPTNPQPTPEMSDKINHLIESLQRALQDLLNRGANKQKWDDANHRVQNLINKLNKNDLSPLAVQAIEGVITSINENDFKSANSKYLQVTSSPYWNEIGSQSMVGLKRIIDLGLKPN